MGSWPQGKPKKKSGTGWPNDRKEALSKRMDEKNMGTKEGKQMLSFKYFT